MKQKFEPAELERLVDSTLRKDTADDYPRLVAEHRKVDPDAMYVYLVWENLERGSLKIDSMEELEDGTSEVSFSCKIHTSMESYSCEIHMKTELSTRSYDCSGKLSLDASGALKSIQWERFEKEPLSEPGDEVFGMEQMIIDPITGKDITAEALTEARREYEVDLEQVIEEAADRIARGAPKTEVWAEAEERIKDLQQRLWDSHKGGWLQDWLEPWAEEDRFTRDLKRARQQLGLDEPQP